MIAVSNLVKRYGRTTAVDGVSFEVSKGDVAGFLGPNGAGKSTTLRILAGFLGRTSGKVTVGGHDVEDEPLAARRCVGYMPEAVPLYPEMRVVEYLAFRAELKGVASRARRGSVDDAMAKANVTDMATTLIGKLSKGYRQRVGLADALVARPPILILDEPTAGLDPNQILEVRAVVRALGAEHTVLVSTHILSEVEATCSRVLVLAKGKLVAEGTTQAIRGMRRSTAADFVVRGDAERSLAVLRGIQGVATATPAPDAEGAARAKGGVVVVRCAWARELETEGIAATTERAVAALVQAGLGVREVKPHGGTLEEVFASLTQDEARGLERAP